MVRFTDAAAARIREAMAQAGGEFAGVRIRAHRLGRYTFRYQVQLVEASEILPDDVVVEAGPVRAVLDPRTAEWMEGATLDWVTVDGVSGFRIDNPAATPRWEDPVARKVQEVLDRRVAPGLAMHGGWVELDRVEGDTAYVVLGGGCQGCAGAAQTLALGVERILAGEVPEIRRVVDVTDHAAGTEPYLSR